MPLGLSQEACVRREVDSVYGHTYVHTRTYTNTNKVIIHVQTKDPSSTLPSLRMNCTLQSATVRSCEAGRRTSKTLDQKISSGPSVDTCIVRRLASRASE